MGEVDQAFAQALEDRPNIKNIEAQGIPTIDLYVLSSFGENPEALADLAKKVGDACRNWGFFQVINHGVPLEKRERILNASREFFVQRGEEKYKVLRKDDMNLMGYYDTERTNDVRDWKQVFDFTLQNPTLLPASSKLDEDQVAKWYSQWPKSPQFREVCEEYVAEMEKLGYKLLELIALSLGLKADRLHRSFKDQTSLVRLNYYPQCPNPDLALGMGGHKDSGALTILVEDDVGGLEVKTKSGQWVSVKPNPNAYIINIAEIIEVWSNGAYESVEHRVKANSEKERLSIPLFFNPAHYTVVKPLDELVNLQNPAKYEPYNWGKFLVSKLYTNFQKLH